MENSKLTEQFKKECKEMLLETLSSDLLENMKSHKSFLDNHYDWENDPSEILKWDDNVEHPHLNITIRIYESLCYEDLEKHLILWKIKKNANKN